MTSALPPAARRAGDLLFVSGQLGIGDSGMVEGGAGDETRQVIANIASVLADCGATLADVVKTTVFLADLADWQAMNEAYLECFDDPRPARSAVCAGLVLGALVDRGDRAPAVGDVRCRCRS